MNGNEATTQKKKRRISQQSSSGKYRVGYTYMQIRRLHACQISYLLPRHSSSAHGAREARGTCAHEVRDAHGYHGACDARGQTNCINR